MAKFVVAGKADCPFYARAELLADELHATLPEFYVHKIVISPAEWDKWVKETCAERKWSFKGCSPLIWRELLDRGGKGILVGSCNEFLEMAKMYYGVSCDKATNDLQSIAQENLSTKKKEEAKIQEEQSKRNPIRMTVTGASHPVAYAIAPYLCNGSLFPDRKECIITLYDRDAHNLDTVSATAMELQDCTATQFSDVIVTANLAEAVKDCDVLLLLDGMQIAKQERLSKDQLSQEIKTVGKTYAKVIENEAKKTAKIFTAGGYSFLLTQTLVDFAPSFPKENIFALCRHEENRVKSQIAKKLNISTAGVRNVLLWGQVPENYYLDTSLSSVVGYDGAIWGPHVKQYHHKTSDVTFDNEWLQGELVSIISARRDVEENNKKQQTLATGATLLAQLHDILIGSNDDELMFSLGLISKGWYGVPENTVFSFPVRHRQGGITEVVHDLSLNEITKSAIADIMNKSKSEYESEASGQ